MQEADCIKPAAGLTRPSLDNLIFRYPAEADLPVITGPIADDAIAAARDAPTSDEARYQAEAFAAIVADPCRRLLVAELDGMRLGSFQLSFVPGVALGGTWRGQIEFVRIASDLCGRGIGVAIMEWAVAQCHLRGCNLVQLTSDTNHPAPHRFSAGLGFRAAHAGLNWPCVKSALPSTPPGR